jgi:hypothetical protein
MKLGPGVKVPLWIASVIVFGCLVFGCLSLISLKSNIAVIVGVAGLLVLLGIAISITISVVKAIIRNIKTSKK